MYRVPYFVTFNRQLVGSRNNQVIKVKQKTNYKKFLLLLSGELISAIGSGLTSFGLGVYVFQETGSAAGTALVTLLAFLPTLLLSVPAGILADRYDRRLLMILGDGLSALGLVYILVSMLKGRASLYQIGIGVFISSLFSSLLEPAYKATVTDLLSPEEYSRASGLVSLAGSARYLISPLIAGLLLSVSDIKLLLVMDIATFFLTAACTAVVRAGLESKKAENKKLTILESFKEGWEAIRRKRGILILIAVSSLMTLFMGAIQILSGPMILDFASSRVLGIAETLCALGMLVSSVIIGIRGLKKSFVRTLSLSLVLAGLAMFGFSLKENIYLICAFGFLFFFMLPLANNCLDYLVRTNIAADKQGRAWGLIGFLSQIGYVVAYGSVGVLADKIALLRQIRIGRGAAEVIRISGLLLALLALALYQFKDVRSLEKNEKTIND